MEEKNQIQFKPAKKKNIRQRKQSSDEEIQDKEDETDIHTKLGVFKIIFV